MKKKEISKKHHYVAQSILWNFCPSGKSLWQVRRDQPEVTKRRNIQKIFHRRHFNSFQLPDGTKDDSVEKFYAYQLDAFIPEWMSTFSRAIEKSGKIHFKSIDSHFRFIAFFYFHTKRSPDFIEPIVEKVSNEVFASDLEDNFTKLFRPLTDKEKLLLEDEEFRSRAVSNARVENFGTASEKIIDTLFGMRLMVATPQSDKDRFIVGSNPVVRFENHPFQRLGTRGVELWTTLSPKIAVGFVHDPKAPEFTPDVLRLPFSDVMKINETLALKSNFIGGYDRNDVELISKMVWQ